MESRFSLDQLEQSRNTHDLKGLDTLRKAAVSGDKQALQEAATQFEAIFVRMMLKSMRDAQDVLADENSPFNSEQVKFYRDMHDQQLATHLAASGSIGLSKIIMQQLGGDMENFTPASVLRNDGNLSSLNRPQAQAIDNAQEQVLGPVSWPGNKLPAFDDPQSFIAGLMPYAEQVAGELGLDPRALVAQAAVETGWGSQMIHLSSGQNSHNLFGIKAGRAWQGDKALVNTLEYKDGVAHSEKAAFRAYGSFSDSLQDYADFIQSNPRYAEALEQTSDSRAYFNALQRAGYATDPHYADKIMKVLHGEQFTSGFQAQVLQSKAMQENEMALTPVAKQAGGQ
ncbi:flagellar assembly peptidoglycan hydrolase FlgJ [Bowmanella dokdonensis]|uniref:Peptidoglycan hydrolase FlgJ n=1 Tax=Bowmanella dokdonensis TaxID=751969 RepID=A0A939DP45_9ALTE|nr:flagellar assembly peptidoglycan hydrolase FlgJ [Bowmanella dokdonensis]MBN7826368.1 flagellar assembly peptidoglycan hydrolase FlgJ [Bowmanella dokdonensis]